MLKSFWALLAFAGAFLQIGTVSSFEVPRFKPDSGFYKTVRARVGKYFEDNKLNYKAPAAGLLRMLPVVVLALLSYLVANHVLLPDAGLGVRCVAAVLLGICTVMPLLHIMHDASHTSIGNSENWWKVIGRGAVRVCVCVCVCV